MLSTPVFMRQGVDNIGSPTSPLANARIAPPATLLRKGRGYTGRPMRLASMRRRNSSITWR
jgi:hypothetical protein